MSVKAQAEVKPIFEKVYQSLSSTWSAHQKRHWDSLENNTVGRLITGMYSDYGPGPVCMADAACITGLFRREITVQHIEGELDDSRGRGADYVVVLHGSFRSFGVDYREMGESSVSYFRGSDSAISDNTEMRLLVNLGWKHYAPCTKIPGACKPGLCSLSRDLYTVRWRH
jgi:hypothetical protein